MFMNCPSLFPAYYFAGRAVDRNTHVNPTTRRIEDYGRFFCLLQ